MAKARVVHSDDAVTVVFKGNPKSPEPSTAIVRFPGGYVEVARTSDGTYWAHLCVDEGARVVHSRAGYTADGAVVNREGGLGSVLAIPNAEHIAQVALRIDGPFLEPGE